MLSLCLPYVDRNKEIIIRPPLWILLHMRRYSIFIHRLNFRFTTILLLTDSHNLQNYAIIRKAYQDLQRYKEINSNDRDNKLVLSG